MFVLQLLGLTWRKYDKMTEWSKFVNLGSAQVWMGFSDPG